MTTERFSTQASTTLSASIESDTLSITVQSTTHFPVLPEFRVRVGQELLLVTGVAGATWTVTRGIEGTTAAGHIAGTAVVAVLTAGALDEMRAEIEAEIPQNTGYLPSVANSALLASYTNTPFGIAAYVTSRGRLYRSVPIGKGDIAGVGNDWKSDTSISDPTNQTKPAWFVSPTGNDDNDGTSSDTPVLTLNEIQSRWGHSPKLSPTTITLAFGTYPTPCTLTYAASGGFLSQ